MNFVNFGAFELENGRFFGENREILYYNSLSEFINDNKKESDLFFNEIDIFAGLNYDSKINSTNNGLVNNDNALKNYTKFSKKLRSFSNSWAYLPGSKIEGNSIRSLWRESKNSAVQVRMFENGDGSESNFKSVVANNSKGKIMHLATHGFFFDKLEFQNLRDTVKDFNNDNSSFRSGIVLSGGNIGWKKFDINNYTDDGILSSYEISKLNFNNVKLIVLSACDTGLGDIQSNEGVFGLQRAIKLAGAEKIIMSLWKVPDLQTKELMTYFYQNLIKGKTFNMSVSFAQSKMKLKYPPFYWAAFKLLN